MERTGLEPATRGLWFRSNCNKTPIIVMEHYCTEKFPALPTELPLQEKNSGDERARTSVLLQAYAGIHSTGPHPQKLCADRDSNPGPAD